MNRAWRQAMAQSDTSRSFVICMPMDAIDGFMHSCQLVAIFPLFCLILLEKQWQNMISSVSILKLNWRLIELLRHMYKLMVRVVLPLIDYSMLRSSLWVECVLATRHFMFYFATKCDWILLSALIAHSTANKLKGPETKNMYLCLSAKAVFWNIFQCKYSTAIACEPHAHIS